MPTIDHFRHLSDYNRWMNQQLFSVCQEIPDSIRKEDKGAFFRSIHGTLNHLLLVDLIWLTRFQEQPFEFESLEQELYQDFDTLRSERQIADDEIDSWINSLTEEQLAEPFKFHSVIKKRECVYPLGHMVMYFFTHQIHHRGQVTTLIKQVGYEPGDTDLLWLPGLEIL